MQLKDAIYNMFGFIITQPIHKTLRQMRFATIFLLLVCVDIMYRLIHILEASNSLSPAETIAAVSALAIAMLGAMWKGISNLSEKHHADD